MQETKPDLVISDLLDDRPVRKLIINTADIASGRLTLIEALDISEASGFPAEQFVSVLNGKNLRDQALLMYAFAWVVARRAEPELTFEEVCTYELHVRGTTVPDGKASAAKAKAVVAVAALAGVSPEEAKHMTIDEVAAVSDLHRRRTVQRSTVHRRRAR